MDDRVSFLELNMAIFGGPSDDRTTIQTVLAYLRTRRFDTPGGILSASFPIIFSLAGLILFVMLIWGAMEIFLAASNPKLAEQGKKRITSAFIGFILLFASFWIGQIIAGIFGIDFGLSVYDPYAAI